MDFLSYQLSEKQITIIMTEITIFEQIMGNWEGTKKNLFETK